MAYKRTTKSGKGGKRTTYTQSFKGPKRSSKITESFGSGRTRITTTTNLNTGERKSYMTQRTSDGWISRKSLSFPKQKVVKANRSKKIRTIKSKPIKLGAIGWAVLAIIIVLLIIT